MSSTSGTDRRGPDRREFIALGLGAFVVAAVPFTTRRSQHVVRRTLPVMGTLAEVAVVHSDVRYAHRAIDAALGELQRVERTMSRFTSTSEIGRANASAARAPMALSAETAAVLREALRWSDATAGRFDPAIGGAVALWDVANRHAPPEGSRVSRLAGRRLHRKVEVESRGRTSFVTYHDPDVQLDLGGIAKGHGVDMAAESLRHWGIAGALVNVGGDLVAVGAGADDAPWRVGIRDPQDDRALIATLELRDAAVATSGTYEQFFRHRGRIFHHLLDPETGAPRTTGMQSLTVQSERCVDADAAATALFGMEPVLAARTLAQRCPDARILRTA